MKKILLVSVIFAFVFLSACISLDNNPIGNGKLSIQISADPGTILTSGKTNLYVDVINTDIKTMSNIEVNIFDTGILEGTCEKIEKLTLSPGQFETLKCILTAPSEIPDESVSTDISVKFGFETNFEITQPIELITEEWYQRENTIGTLQTKPSSYSYSDKNIQVDIEFTSEMPIISESDRTEYMYITIKNIGNGLIKDLTKEDISIIQISNVVDESKIPETMHPIDNTFPRIAVPLTLPGNIDYLKNYEIILKIKYKYELRDKISINIIRWFKWNMN